MMRSLYSGVSGLRVHQTKMDVIGNNIANVNTVAYKGSSVTFSDVFYQTTQSASGPNADTGRGGQNAMQIGIGANVGSISTAIETEGAAQRTDNAFDLKLSGSSFFIVNNGGQTYFTRAGDFKVDESGNLVTSGGANVMGWKADESGNVIKDQVQPLSVKSAEFTYTPPAETTACRISGNLNSSDGNFAKGSTVPMSITFYDNLGYSYIAEINISQTDSANYTMEVGKITCEGQLTNLKGTIDTADLKFDKDTGLILTDTSSFNISFATDPDAPDTALEINTTINDINVDVSGIKTYGDQTSFTYARGNAAGEGAGKAVGKMSSVGIQTDGRIVANYSNGDTKVLGQIAVQTFANPSGLEKVGSNLYSATLNSGMFDGIGEDVTASKGSIASGQLEMSNVDLSSEFTEMITTQRGFQANSRIITVSDTMIEELVNLKR